MILWNENDSRHIAHLNVRIRRKEMMEFYNIWMKETHIRECHHFATIRRLRDEKKNWSRFHFFNQKVKEGSEWGFFLTLFEDFSLLLVNYGNVTEVFKRFLWFLDCNWWKWELGFKWINKIAKSVKFRVISKILLFKNLNF